MRGRGTTEIIEEVSPEQPADLQPGDTAVWRARDRAGRTVRVKLWGGRLAPDHRELIVAFHNQAKRLASLHSAHAMRVLGHGLDPWRRPYLITECPEGETLAARFASGRPLADSPEAAVTAAGRFVHQMAAVLSELHAIGRVAGVLSDENVFLVESPTLFVKLLDVGMPDPCCSGVITHTTPDAALRALEALAPEHGTTRSLDGRADIWSVAVLAYRILTGHHPFLRSTFDETQQAQRTSGFMPPSRRLPSLEPGLAAALDAWFQRALSPSPDTRFDDMMAMSDAWPDEDDPVWPTLEGEELGETLFFPRAEDSGVHTIDDDPPTRLAFVLDEVTRPEQDVETDTSLRRRIPTDEIPLPAPTTGEETSGITAAVKLLAPLDARGSIAPGPVSSPPPSYAERDAVRRERLAAFEAARRAHQQRVQQATLIVLILIALLASAALVWFAG